MAHADSILDVQDLKTSFFTEDGEVRAVDGVSFSLRRGETLGLVGESGCGKSVTALSIMRLLGRAGRIVDGRVLYHGEDLASEKESDMRRLRGKSISMIFQEPMTSLNPVFPIGDQIAEALRIHEGLDARSAKSRSVELIKMVGISSPERRARQFPFELSGGMRQRIMIAMAIACNPEILIADEPTTALDVTIQAQILDLLKDIQRRLGLTILLITHDLGVVAQTCDRVAVMYAGKVVEEADVETLFETPRHPYTVGLLDSLPLHHEVGEELRQIPGTVPSPNNMPKGCRFAPRCPHARDLCRGEEPTLDPVEGKTAAANQAKVRCWIYTPRWTGEEAKANG